MSCCGKRARSADDVWVARMIHQYERREKEERPIQRYQNQKWDHQVETATRRPSKQRLLLLRSWWRCTKKLRTESRKDGRRTERWQKTRTEKSVIILFSTVRSNRSGSIGFLTDWRQMYVALTRAKNSLIVVGDLECLEDGDKHWAAFGKCCRGVQCVVE